MFGKRLNATRKHKGYTALYMAEQLNMQIRSYRRYESGHCEPSLESLRKIADILEVSVDYLLGRDEFIKNWEDSLRK